MSKSTLEGDDKTVEAIATLAQCAAGNFRPEVLNLAKPVTGLPDQITVLVREGEHPAVEDVRKFFEPYRTTPERRIGTAQVTTLRSFIDLVNRHKDEHSALFGVTTWPNPKLTAVIDYHTTDRTAQFGQHRVVYDFPLTPEFKAWIDSNGKPMLQGDFASFVEDRIADLGAPYDAEVVEYERLFRTKIATPAEMVDLSRGLQVHVTSAVKNATVLQTGEAEIAFVEEHRNDKGDRLTVPGVFMIAVKAFIDGEPVRVPARLRYRVKEGRVVWTYHLYNWDLELRERVLDDLRQAADGTELPAYEGTPEMGAGR